MLNKKLRILKFLKPKKPSHNFQIENFIVIDLHGYKQESKKKKTCVWLIKVNQNSDSIFYTIVACVLQSIPLMSKKGKVTRVHIQPLGLQSN